MPSPCRLDIDPSFREGDAQPGFKDGIASPRYKNGDQNRGAPFPLAYEFQEEEDKEKRGDSVSQII